MPKLLSFLLLGFLLTSCCESEPRYHLDCSDSTAISEASYDPATRILRVTFVGGNITYTHDDFSEATWMEWKKADSKGEFYSQHIRSQQSGEE